MTFNSVLIHLITKNEFKINFKLKMVKNSIFYDYKIYHKNLGKSQFSSSIIKRNFNIESKPMGFI